MLKESVLSHIELLVDGERYREALENIERLRKKKLDKGKHLRIGVLESRCLEGLGEFIEAFKVAQSVYEKAKGHREQKVTAIEALLEMAAAGWKLGQPDDVLQACTEAERIREELKKDGVPSVESIKADILYHESLGWYLRNETHKAIDCVRKSLSIREALNDRLNVIKAYMRLGYVSIEIDMSQALKYQETALELNRELNHKDSIILALLCKGLVRANEGRKDEAERLLKQSKQMIDEYDIRRRTLESLFNLAFLYYSKGDFLVAAEYYKECLSLSERVGAKLFITFCSINLGEIHRARGDLDEALKCNKRAMELSQEMGRSWSYDVALANCGLIEHAKGNLEEALRLLQESLSSAEEREDGSWIAARSKLFRALYVVIVLTDLGKIEKARERVEMLRPIVEDRTEEVAHQLYKIAAAIVLKGTPLSRNRTLAREYLTEVVDGRPVNIEVSTLAHLLLCDLLVEDLGLSGDKRALDELKRRLASLVDTSVDQGSASLQAEALLLQSKVALLELDTKEADRLMTQAHLHANEKGLQIMADRIANEHKNLLSELGFWEALKSESPTLTEQTERVRINEHLGRMLQQGVWRKMLF